MHDRLLEDQIRAMDPAQFERLVFELARADDAAVARIGAPDGGADCLRPASTDCGCRVWQAKHHTRRIGWADREASLDRALSTWEPQQVTFVFPQDLSSRAAETFTKRLASRAPTVHVEYWGLSELVARLRASPALIPRFFGRTAEDLGDKLERAINTGGRLEDGQDLERRARAIAEFVHAADPEWRFEVVAGSNDDLPPWQNRPRIAISRGEEGSRVHIGAWPRERRFRGVVEFTDDTAGHSLWRSVAEALARSDAIFH